METGRVYTVDGYDYKWNGICYVFKHSSENDFEWRMVRTYSFHMDVINHLEYEYWEEEVF